MEEQEHQEINQIIEEINVKGTLSQASKTLASNKFQQVLHRHSIKDSETGKADSSQPEGAIKL